MATKKRRKNPQDATLRNIRAAHKKAATFVLMIKDLNWRVTKLEGRLIGIGKRLFLLERRDRA